MLKIRVFNPLEFYVIEWFPLLLGPEYPVAVRDTVLFP
jgi:hypothetical protein